MVKQLDSASDRPTKHAFVTGGGSGIGAAIVAELARSGAHVSLVGRRIEKLQECVDEVGQGDVLFAHECDVSDEQSVTTAVGAAVERFGTVDILVNNAGSVRSAPFLKTSLNDWNSTLGVNLTGVYLCTQAVLPKMLEQKWGRIINIASTAGLTGYQYVAAYCAAKHAVMGLTRALALEIAGKNVTVNAVCPGFTDTDLLRNAISDVAEKSSQSEAEIEAEFLSNIPQGRFVTPEEVAQSVVWLADEQQRSITGQSITISGGEVL